MRKLLSSKKARKVGYFSAFLAASLFGSISTVAKPALSEVNPIFLSSMVYLLAALVASPIARKEGLFTIKKNDWLMILAIATSGAIIAPTLYFTGLAETKASDAAVLSNAEIVFTVLIALAFFKERLNLAGYIAVAMVLIGTFIVTTNLEFSDFVVDLENRGSLLILAAVAFWALDNNISKVVSQRVDVSRLVQLKSVIGGGMLMVVVLLSGLPTIGINYYSVLNIIVLGTAGFGASLFFFLHSLKRIGTVRTMLIFSTSAIFGLFFAAVFLHEDVGVYQIVAIAVMLSGIYLIERHDERKAKKIY